MEPPATAPRPSSSGFLGWIRTAPRRLYDWVLHWAETPYAVTALIVLSIAEASFFPIPPDVLLIAICMSVPQRAFRAAAACSAASVLGGLLGYAIGALLWTAVEPTFYAYVPGFTPEVFAAVQERYVEYGVWIVFTAGFTPIPYKIFTIASGVMEQPLVPFVVASAVGRSGRFFLVAALIFWFGRPVKAFIDRYFNLLAMAFTVLLIGGFVVLKWAF